jgi:hypothetical protein
VWDAIWRTFGPKREGVLGIDGPGAVEIGVSQMLLARIFCFAPTESTPRRKEDPPFTHSNLDKVVLLSLRMQGRQEKQRWRRRASKGGWE